MELILQNPLDGARQSHTRPNQPCQLVQSLSATGEYVQHDCKPAQSLLATLFPQMLKFPILPL